MDFFTLISQIFKKIPIYALEKFAHIKYYS